MYLSSSRSASNWGRSLLPSSFPPLARSPARRLLTHSSRSSAPLTASKPSTVVGRLLRLVSSTANRHLHVLIRKYETVNTISTILMHSVRMLVIQFQLPRQSVAGAIQNLHSCRPAGITRIALYLLFQRFRGKVHAAYTCGVEMPQLPDI